MTTMPRSQGHPDAFGYRVLIRSVQVVAGLITMYGILAMLTSAGLEGPNAIVYVGVALVTIAAVAQRRLGMPWSGGWSLFLGALSGPLALITIRTFGSPECTASRAPLSPSLYCVGAGSHAVFVLAATGVIVALGAASMRLLRRRTS